MNEPDLSDAPPVTELSKPQRRVFGVLLEKAFTTPEYYPLTLKAIVSGCNQKSNRDPVTHYSEDDVLEALDQLRELGLAAVVHTESGRTERFRHYARKRFDFSEPQLAIMTELFLRGRQTLGELRTRASRMVSIGDLDQLRAELAALKQGSYIQASGDLERRGVEVDHNLYPPEEGRSIGGGGTGEPAEAPSRSAVAGGGVSLPHPPPGSVPAPSEESRTLSALHQATSRLESENEELRGQISALRDKVEQMCDVIEQLRKELGG